MGAQGYDVVVVGGGAAGLSAALVLGRARRRVAAVVDGGAPRNAPAAHLQGFLSRDGLPPAELLAVGRREVEGYGVELICGDVASIEAGFTVHLADGRTQTARRILVTTGLVDQLPDIPGVRERWGRDLGTARTATGGRCGTSRWASWARWPARSSTPCWCGSGPTTSRSSSATWP